MLKIKNLKIEIETKNKKFGREVEFLTNGLTLIRGDNHSGKTTLSSAIFYGLGMEELLGGKNTIALDSILTSKVPDAGFDLDVITSVVFLEIENSLGKSIKLKRYIKHFEIEPRIIEVIDGEESDFYYLHDGGSAISQKGFYNYLEKFLNLSLPTVPKFDGNETKLYLQVIFNAFFIEQIKGWTDYFAAIPNYGIKDAKKRIVEYILDLKTFEYEKQKSKYEDTKKDITLQWDKQINKIKDKVEIVSGVIKNIPEKVIGEELLSKTKYDVLFKVNEKSLTIEEYLETLENKKNEIEKIVNKPKSNVEKKLFDLKEKLGETIKDVQLLKNNIGSKSTELEKLTAEEKNLEDEIKSINDLLKIQKYTSSEDNTNKLFKGECPTCEQPISLSIYKHIEVLGLEDNKTYIKSQKNILAVYIKALEKEITNEKYYLNQILEEYESDKKIIEYLEKDFVSDAKMPSYASMKELIIIEDKIEKVNTIKKELIELYKELRDIGKLWEKNEKLKQPFDMSFEDKKKINLLQSSFKTLLKDFMYGSKREDQIWIATKDNSKYFPMIQIGHEAPQLIRYNSSASDFVRSIWAYLIALYEVSKFRNGNHLGILLFDEPAQHAMTESSQAALFKKLSNLECQSIVFASFENKTDDKKDIFSEVTKDLEIQNFKVETIQNRAIIELDV